MELVSFPIGQKNGPATGRAPTCRSSAYVHENLSPPPPRRTSERIRRLATAYHALGLDDSSHNEDSERFQLVLDELDRLGRNTDGNPNDKPYPPHACFLVTLPTAASDLDRCSRPMPKIELPPVFPNRPLNLNLDGTPTNYRKSHSGPPAEYWAKADGEEIERLFVTGAIKPERFGDIPHDKVVTYVNPVCVEKTNDDGSLKFRTRLTIGGDRIQYPYDTAAEMDAIKILLNCMISENAKWSTLDLTDFYLGTDLPHPEYIRIPRNLIPEKVIDFYELDSFFTNNAIYCSVHKTHYGLPQAGALSQQRLFRHLQEHGYTQIPSSPSVFRNKS